MNRDEDFELTLFDRLEKIKQVVSQFGEENFYVSFSGGKDSTVLHYLVDMALPGNGIPRVFCNTGIEYVKIVEFVKSMAEKDSRFQMIFPKKNIRKTLEEVGYPFKSKEHSEKLKEFRKRGYLPKYMERYITGMNRDGTATSFKCPKVLLHQFSMDYPLKVSELCCDEMKKKPFKQWMKENGKTIAITGMKKEEGGTRLQLNCITNKGTKFHPLAVVSEEFEDWFIDKYSIRLCELYYPPFNFKRTGCKGCPFSLELQKQLDVMEKLLPNERKQCEVIWKPVYDEYRRIGYRLKSVKHDCKEV